jgi:hypothetical protein
MQPSSHCRRRPSDQGADRRTCDDVAWVVDAGVNARERHNRGGRPQRHPESGHHSPDRDGERRRRCCVAGRERGRRRHPHPSALGNAQLPTVRAATLARQLQWLVYHEGGDPDRGHSGRGGSATPRSPHESEHSRDHEPRLGEVGEIGHPSQRSVQQRGGHFRHGAVRGAVEAAEPAENPHRS